VSDAILSTAGLGKSFGHFAANSEIDFSVNEGELRAVIGPNGAGKTTFFNLLSGIAQPTSGRITFKGQDITTLAGPRRVERGIAKAFQTSNIYPDESVLQNCRIAALAKVQGAFSPEFFRPSQRLGEVDEIARESLALVDLTGLAEERSGGLIFDYPISETEKRPVSYVAQHADPDLFAGQLASDGEAGDRLFGPHRDAVCEIVRAMTAQTQTFGLNDRCRAFLEQGEISRGVGKNI